MIQKYEFRKNLFFFLFATTAFLSLFLQKKKSVRGKSFAMNFLVALKEKKKFLAKKFFHAYRMR